MSPMATPRWIGLSAIVASSVSAIALAGSHAGAAPGGAEASYVAIPPCRLVDTRPEFQVGARTTPIGSNETHDQQVTGKVGACDIPNSAVGVSLNVTAVNPTAPSFMTLYPSDAPLPLASNLNYLPGGPPTPNKVDVKLSATGAIGIYNLAGTVDVVADVGGYYTNAGIEEIMEQIDTKPDAADVYTKLETYSRQQVDGAMDTLDSEVATELGEKVDVGDVYTQDQVDVALTVLETALNTELEDKVDPAQLTAAVEALNTALADKASTGDLDDAIVALDTALDGKATTGDLDDAIATLNTALDGKVDAGSVYSNTQQENLFMGRNPDLVMRQATGDLDGVPGADLSGLGVVIGVGTSAATELIGPAAIGDAIKGEVDYRLNVVEVCTTEPPLLEAAVLDTITVTVRGLDGVLSPVTLPVGLPDTTSGADCYTIDVSAIATGDTYYLELDATGDVGAALAVTNVTTAWGPVPPPAL